MSDFDKRFTDRKPRIFVGICSFGDIPKEAFVSWMQWWGMQCARLHDRFDLFLGVSPRKEQYRARNYLVNAAEGQAADFLLMIDDDQIVNICPDMIEKFWSLGKPVMGGLYFQRGGLYHPVVMKEFPSADNKKHYRFLHIDELPAEPTPVDVVGHGVHFVDMAVMREMKQPFFWPHPCEEVFVPDPDLGLDVHFCQKVRDAGYEVWLHPGVLVGHLSIDRSSVDLTTRPAQALIEQSPRWKQYWAEIQMIADGHDPRIAAVDPTRLGVQEYAVREAFRPAYAQLAEALCGTFDFDTVLDIGSGQGFIIDELASRGKSVQGIEKERDAVPFMSEVARKAIVIGDVPNGASPVGSFGLVTCIEVAEHVEAGRSDAIVAACANTAKEYVFFTASNRKSRFHLNPQPKDYWIEKFGKHGFVHDDEKTERVYAMLDGIACSWLQENAMVFRKTQPEAM